MVETVSQIPLLFPITVQVAAGATRVISFPDEFLGYAVSLLVQNEDGANAATIRIGGASQAALNVPASAFRTWDNVDIKLIEIVAGAGGVTIVQAQLRQRIGVETQ